MLISIQQEVEKDACECRQGARTCARAYGGQADGSVKMVDMRVGAAAAELARRFIGLWSSAVRRAGSHGNNGGEGRRHKGGRPPPLNPLPAHSRSGGGGWRRGWGIGGWVS